MDKIEKYLLSNGFILEKKSYNNFIKYYKNGNINIKIEGNMRVYVYFYNFLEKEFRNYTNNIALSDFIPYMTNILRKMKIKSILYGI